jgi:hypothetical protein
VFEKQCGNSHREDWIQWSIMKLLECTILGGGGVL